jgi:GntR family transcriptional regulator/MocR family aminotransferase
VETGLTSRTTFVEKLQTSLTRELLLPVAKGQGSPLGRQIEEGLREAIRAGTLKAGMELPSTRDLAAQLDLSRAVVVDAYAQLAAEGFIRVSQGARPRVAEAVRDIPKTEAAAPVAPAPARYDFLCGVPDLRSFPIKAWLRASRRALEAMHPREFGYDDRFGSSGLRQALAEYLGRVRGVVAEPGQVVVTSGFAQTRTLFCRALARCGVRSLAVEDPSYTDWTFAQEAGLELVHIPVDDRGIVVEALAASGAQAVILTPSHQSPTGHALSGARRLSLLEWLDDQERFALEDDYDAEFRYDRSPIGALQGRAPNRIVYAGTASKTLAPGLRIGWFVAPESLREPLLIEHQAASHGTSRLEQNVLASLIRDGEFDRHLRKTRLVYRSRRDAVRAAVAEFLPGAVVEGIAAGLHAVVRLSGQVDEPAIVAEARRHGIAVEFLSHYEVVRASGSALLIGYAQSSEPTIRSGVRRLAEILTRMAAPA